VVAEVLPVTFSFNMAWNSASRIGDHVANSQSRTSNVDSPPTSLCFFYCKFECRYKGNTMTRVVVSVAAGEELSSGATMTGEVKSSSLGSMASRESEWEVCDAPARKMVCGARTKTRSVTFERRPQKQSVRRLIYLRQVHPNIPLHVRNVS
jgi:hypothetical protein